jgi:hypothetical protein
VKIVEMDLDVEVEEELLQKKKAHPIAPSQFSHSSCRDKCSCMSDPGRAYGAESPPCQSTRPREIKIVVVFSSQVLK